HPPADAAEYPADEGTEMLLYGDARPAASHRHHDLELPLAGARGRDPGKRTTELAHLPDVLQHAPRLLDHDRVFALGHLAVDDALDRDPRRTSDPEVRADGRLTRGDRRAGRRMQRVHGRADRVGLDPDFG